MISDTCDAGFIPLDDVNDGSVVCIQAPDGVQPPSDQPTEEGVELVAETAFSFEGGKTGFDTADNKAKFEAAVVLAMASSPDGLIGVQCKVSVVTTSRYSRRLAFDDLEVDEAERSLFSAFLASTSSGKVSRLPDPVVVTDETLHWTPTSPSGLLAIATTTAASNLAMFPVVSNVVMPPSNERMVWVMSSTPSSVDSPDGG